MGNTKFDFTEVPPINILHQPHALYHYTIYIFVEMTSAEVLFFRTMQSHLGLGCMSLWLRLFLPVLFLPLPFRESSRDFLPQVREKSSSGERGWMRKAWFSIVGRERKRRLGREKERGRGDQRNRREREKEAIWKREEERKRRSENSVNRS